MTSLSQPDPGSAPELAQVAPVAADQAAPIEGLAGAMSGPHPLRQVIVLACRRNGKTRLVGEGIRHGRLGLGLGGGLS